MKKELIKVMTLQFDLVIPNYNMLDFCLSYDIPWKITYESKDSQL